MNAQYNCVLYDGSDYKCTELLCNKAAPAAIAQQKPPENTCPPAKQCAASNGGFLYVPCFLFIIRSQQTIDQPPLFFAGAMIPVLASLGGCFYRRLASRGSLRLTHRLTALACPEAKKARPLAGLFLCFYPISSAHGQSIAKPVVVCRGHDAYDCLAQGAVFIGDYPKEICFAQQLSANRCYLASPGPFGSKAREVIRLFPGLFLYRNQEDAAVRKKFVRARKAQSEHAYKSLFIFRQKKIRLAAPSRGCFMFLSYLIRPQSKLTQAPPLLSG